MPEDDLYVPPDTGELARGRRNHGADMARLMRRINDLAHDHSAGEANCEKCQLIGQQATVQRSFAPNCPKCKRNDRVVKQGGSVSGFMCEACDLVFTDTVPL